MAISYPITLPTSPGFRRVSIQPRSAVALYASPFTYQQQTYAHQGQMWTGEFELPPMSRAEAAPWVAAIVSLNGTEGTFYFGDPAWAAPRGSAGGFPRINGASETGQTIDTDGWTASQANTIFAGDWVQIGSENQVEKSQELDNAFWTKSGATVTADGTTAPDGTATADKLVEDSANSTHYLLRSVTSGDGAWCFSCYAKADERSRIYISIDDNTTGGVGLIANLSTGATAFTSSSGNWTATGTGVESVGSGWYRIYVAGIKSAGSVVNIIAYLDNGSTQTYLGDGSSGLHIWGVQLNKGLKPAGYQPTTTAVVSTTPQLFMAVSGAHSGGSGNAALTLWPNVRTAFADNTPLTVNYPKGVWRLSSPVPWGVSVDSLVAGLTVQFVQAL